MKRFQFSLQKLLNCRVFYEKEAEINLGRAVSAREAILMHLVAIAQEERKTRLSLKVRGVSMDVLSTCENYLERLHRERGKKEEALVEAELAVDKMQALYIKAHQDRLIVSKLQERKASQWRACMLKEQDAALDDLINAREYKKAGQGAVRF